MLMKDTPQTNSTQMNKQIPLHKLNEEKELKLKNNYIQSNNTKLVHSLFFPPFFYLFFSLFNQFTTTNPLSKQGPLI